MEIVLETVRLLYVEELHVVIDSIDEISTSLLVSGGTFESVTS